MHKIPFTCSYQPGGANLIYLWPMYAAGFILGGYEVAGWEQWLLQDGWRMAASLVLMSAALIWSKHRRGRSPAGGYQFEDDPEPVVQTLLTN
ncbi:MAG: hypothetical protein ACRD0Y_03330 [Terriglobales bacterium]